MTQPPSSGHPSKAERETETASKQGHEHSPTSDPHPKGKEKEELERLRKEAEAAKEQVLRTLADVDNTKKRLAREKEEFAKYAAETLIRELLPVVDSLDQALVAGGKPSNPQAVVQGVQLIRRQLLGLLDKEGIKRIPTVGERFDPHQHEAVAQVETDDHTADGAIIEEVQVGYTMHGKVIRPALVKVARHQADSRQQTADGKEQSQEDR